MYLVASIEKLTKIMKLFFRKEKSEVSFYLVCETHKPVDKSWKYNGKET